MIPQDANKVDNELRFISLKVERAHTGRLYKGARVIRTLSAGALHSHGAIFLMQHHDNSVCNSYILHRRKVGLYCPEIVVNVYIPLLALVAGHIILILLPS
jgi:hypothetical protein